MRKIVIIINIVTLIIMLVFAPIKDSRETLIPGVK